ncbi:src-like-adapter [Seriola lalandi dorsalis]|uniref:Src-like-adapter n=1 Tax=Seriola lalandi dorsalis TaxID=1841481 RepID=A0A3B4X447_SERLL|nr:src-like-adapter [Seriola lalandi dorsalis]XP_023267884.1 src-like-adapter [Seriola lalandi dorsalis]XP_056254434.1 src like adaptor 1a [Seriola aureovittata]
MGNMMGGVRAKDKDKTENPDSSQKGSEDMVVVLQDYPSPEISEPIYRMGEKLRVIAQEAYWWRVRSVQTGKENYIPNSHVAKVYHGWLFEGVERQKAEELLLLPGNRVGSFLVRESTRERGVYSLSVKHMIIKHYRIFRLDNSWYYISPRLTFQCLEDMINHYSDSSDGLCCVLTSPCLSATTPQSAVNPEAPPVVMRRNFDWKKIDRTQLVSTESCSDNMVSYGVRNSIAAYLSFSGNQDPAQISAKSRKKKSKSVYAFPENSLAKPDYEDDF